MKVQKKTGNFNLGARGPIAPWVAIPLLVRQLIQSKLSSNNRLASNTSESFNIRPFRPVVVSLVLVVLKTPPPIPKGLQVTLTVQGVFP